MSAPAADWDVGAAGCAIAAARRGDQLGCLCSSMSHSVFAEGEWRRVPSLQQRPRAIGKEAASNPVDLGLAEDTCCLSEQEVCSKGS